MPRKKSKPQPFPTPWAIHAWKACGLRGYTLVDANESVIAESSCYLDCQWEDELDGRILASLVHAVTLVNGSKAKVIRPRAKRKS